MSSQDFIRSLKAASDPPQPNGPSKLDIARAGWENSALYVPRKDEVIADWILTKLHKDHASPLDSGLWRLLADVTSHPQLPLKTWLPPLLARNNLLNAINHLLTGLSNLQNDTREPLLDSACTSISQLWPFAARKFSVDALHESFGTLVETLKIVDMSESLKRLSGWISNAFRVILSSSSTKKKVFTTFTQKHLASWSACISRQSFHVGDFVYETGVEILLNLDLIRQWDDNEKVLFEALRNARSSTLPLLFASYIAAIKRFRGALFGQTSSQQTFGDVDNIRQAASRFFLSCQGVLETMQKTDRYWSTQTGLVQVLAQGAYYAGQQELEEALHKLVDFAATSLKSYSIAEDDQQTAAAAAETLYAITSVEYNIIAPAVSRILSHILVIPSTSDSYYALLDGILEYHSRTRTVNEYTHLLLALPFDATRSSADSHKDVVVTTVTSPLMHPRHLEQLAKSIATFLTSTQILPLFQHLASRARVCGDEFISAQDGVKSKRQSNANAPTDPLATLESASLKLLLTYRLTSSIITALPLKHLAADAHSKYDETLQDFYAFFGSIITKALKYFNKHSASKLAVAQASATAMAAIMRLPYVLRQRHPELRTSPSEKLMSRLQEFTGEKERTTAYPQLAIEIFRHYLDHVEHWNGFDGMGSIIEFLARTMDSGVWSIEAGILMQILCQRWLPVLDCYASPEQLDAFVRVLFGQAVDASPSLQFCLTSGVFWELTTLRNHVLSYVGKATEPSKKKKSFRITASVSLFRVLLSFPSDYFPRPLKLELLKRARVADSTLVAADTKGSPTLEGDLTALRTFALRTMASLGVDQTVDDIPATVEELLAIPTQDEALLDATFGLIRLYLSSAIAHGTEATLQKLLNVDVNADMFTDQTVQGQYVLLVVDVVSKDVVPAKFSTEIINTLNKLRSNLVDALEPRLKTAESPQTSIEQLRRTLVGWQHALRVSRWLGTNEGSALALYGPRMCLLCMQSDGADQALVDVSISVLKEEALLTEPSKRSTLLDILLESYIMLSGAHATDLDGHMSEVMRQLNVDEYARATATVQERLRHPATPHLDRVVSLAGIMLQDNPKDTFHHVQAFVAACFTAFGNPLLLQLPAVRSQVCSLVLNRCRERAAVLRSVDANAIWSIISGLLAGSQTHESTTLKQVFHDVVGILTALVRHRRDLVIQSLPHLSECLRKLLLLMRRLKPQLGGKQSAMISDAFPVWLSPSDPLDAEEAKALSRLLEALLTKTIIRTFSSSTETAKAESLVKAFGKHAPFVITAFIEAITHPLCVFPVNVKKELQTGLFALCEIMNEHDRNALMVTTLGVNGRLVMKALWKEYEKQRYVGRG